MSLIPIYKYPTKVFLIDDNSLFLKTLYANLNKSENYYELYTNPQKALEIINSEYTSNFWTKKFNFSNLMSNSYEEWNLSFKLYDLPKIVYNHDRFNEVSVIIVDYNMPAINGIDFCKKIVNPFIKKILLTGDSDTEIAVKAFNDGIIDYYITKSDNNLYSTVNEAVKKMCIKYFTELSSTAYSIIIANNLNKSSLIEQNFENIFKHYIEKYKIVEYYLFESFGCYIMLDNSQNIYGLFIYPESDVTEVLDDITASIFNFKDIFIKSPQIMCYHKIDNPSFPEKNEKIKYLKKAKIFNGNKNKFYYAFTSDNIDLDKNKITFFAHYISSK